MNIKLGAHQSIVGGYDKAIHRISKIKGNCLQIFSSSPRTWSFPEIDNKDVDNFIKVKKEKNIDPVYFHATYLINLAGSKKIVNLSIRFLIHELKLAAKLKIKGSVIHLGSYKETNTIDDLAKNIKYILQNTPTESFFIIENSGTRKIGLRLEEISKIIKKVNNKRVKVCLDSCHLNSAGYDLSSKDKLNLFLNLFNRIIGLNSLELFHINDSKDSLGSLRDRHENILQGKISKNTFRTLLNHKVTKKYPFIIETPGFDNNGPDKKNLDILKSLVN